MNNFFEANPDVLKIKAIETVYNDYHFRSRLEARWAVFFDAAGIEYKYEHEGFTNNFGDCYLPDFYLPASKTWVEVKGDDMELCRDWERMSGLLDFNACNLPGFDSSYGSNGGLLLLGDIPNGKNKGCYFHPIIQHHKGLGRSWAMFVPSPGFSPIECIKESKFLDLLGLYPDWGLESSPDHWRVETKWIDTPGYWEKISSAYSMARQARFEHGECG